MVRPVSLGHPNHKKAMIMVIPSAKTKTSKNSFSERHRSASNWLLLFGLSLESLAFALATGVLLLGGVAAQIVGTGLIAAGTLLLLLASGVERWGWVVLWITSGLMYVPPSIAVFNSIDDALVMLEFWLVFAFALCGSARLVIAVASQATGWRWMAASGLVSMAGAILVIAGWSAPRMDTLGLILAIDLFGQGTALTASGLRLRGRWN